MALKWRSKRKNKEGQDGPEEFAPPSRKRMRSMIRFRNWKAGLRYGGKPLDRPSN